MRAEELKALLEEADGLFNAKGEELADIISRLSAALREVTAWRPMETAPRDGTDVLVADEGGELFVAFWEPTDEQWIFATSPRGWRVGVAKPVGWLPLPPVEVPR